MHVFRALTRVSGAVFGVLALGAPAQAQQGRGGPEIAFNAAVSTDFISRGVSLSEGDPAVSGGVDVGQGLFYAGVWAGNASFEGDPDTKAEIDLYAGIRPSFGGFDWDFSVAHYSFAGQPSGAGYNFSELRAEASRTTGPVTWGALVYWSPNFFGAEEDEATYAEISGAISPADRWTISAGVARQWVSSDADYNTWNLGAGYQLTPRLALDVRYYDTDKHEFGAAYGSRAVASLSAAF
jgi:uncharacterized protein (TIGR02001 family)